jgi:hypothetical protein
MKYPLLEPATTLAAGAVVFGALALGVGKPAWGATPVTEEQAHAAALAARALDDSASENSDIDNRTIDTALWSDSNESPAWYPGSSGGGGGGADDTTATRLTTLSASPMQTSHLATGATLAAQEASVIPNEHAVIPLPAAAWTGLAGLTSLATIRARKAIGRFFT